MLQVFPLILFYPYIPDIFCIIYKLEVISTESPTPNSLDYFTEFFTLNPFFIHFFKVT